jgi:hypothetical protein
MKHAALVILVAGAACKDSRRPAEQSPDPAPAEPPPVDPAPPDPRRDSMIPMPLPTPVLAEDAHPDYPTPAGAGTEKIFFLEDPDRGPKAPVKYALPARGTLRWTTHASCELDTIDVVCSGPPPQGSLWMWRVGRLGKQITLAERLRGKQVEETHVYLRGADDTPTQRITLDDFERVQSALVFRGRNRYSGRERNGSNALDGCGMMQYTLDAAGRTTVLSCLQWLGEPMLDKSGVATTKYVRDKRGFITGMKRFGLDGLPIADAEGIHDVRYDLDAYGRVTAEHYFDSTGKPTATTTGCHGLRTDRDGRGAVVRETCIDAGGQPAARDSGVSVEAFKVSVLGCRIGVRYLGIDGRPVLNHSRLHGLDQEVDQRCRITVKTCLDLFEQPAACGPSEAARQVDVRDMVGRVISSRHFAEDGSPTDDGKYSSFELRQTYDDLDNRIGQSCHDQYGEPKECGDTGYHAEKRTYDDAGRELEERYFDEHGNPSTNVGTAIHRSRYDNYDHVFEIRDFDADGKLIETMGSAVRRDLYDASHRRFGILMLDAAEKPAKYAGCYAGATCPSGDWHALRIVRHADGTAARNMFFDQAGQLIETFDCLDTRCFD